MWIIHEAATHLDEWDDFKSIILENGQNYKIYNQFEKPPLGDIVRCPVWDAIRYNNHQGMRCDLDQLNAVNYYREFNNFLGREWISVALGEFRSNPAYWINQVSSENKFFIKPSEFGKVAGAHVIQKEEIDYYIKRYRLSDDRIMILSSPILLLSEYRIIINNNKALTSCQYKKMGKMYIKKLDNDFESTVLEYANHVLSSLDIQYNNPFVLDVGIDENGNFIIVEINSFCSSGFYKCDLHKIVKEIGVSECQ